MHRILLTILTLCLGVMNAQAGMVRNAAQQEQNYRNSLWWNSSNAAAQAFRPIAVSNELSLSWKNTSGAWRPVQQAERSNSLALDTRGVAMVGAFRVWGDFAFRDLFEQGLNYNCALYEVPEDLPYYIVDPQVSRWNRQEYDMGVGLASPVMWDRASFGIELRYVNKVGAKQRDPRVETRVMNLKLAPSVTIRMGERHLFGLTGLFHYDFELSDPMNNSPVNQAVAVSRGLGEGTGSVVGGNTGLAEFMYTTYRYGGGVQYNFNGPVDLLVDAGLRLQDVDVEQQISLPKNMGCTRQTLLHADAQLLWGSKSSNKLSLGVYLRDTEGIEKVQHRDDTPFHQKWVTDAENKMSFFHRLHAEACYDHHFGIEETTGYTWKLGGSCLFDSEDDSYPYAPASYDWSTVFVQAFGARNFALRGSSILASLSAGYGYSLGGSYVYGGTANALLQQPYLADIAYRTDDYLQFSGCLSWAFGGGSTRYLLTAGANYSFVPADRGRPDRLLANLSFGILF